MIDRYPNTAGCRLDDGSDDPQGQALDLHGRLPAARLWVRQEDDFTEAAIILGTRDLIALHQGIGRMLNEHGVRVEVPATALTYSSSGRTL